jgi:ubiquinol oxidase
MIVIAQGIFYNLFFLLYLFSAKTAHRLVGYFEEEAVYSYSEYLNGVESGKYENIAAPQIAINYWHLNEDARLSDVIMAVRNDEMNHRDVNHNFASLLTQ